MAEKSSPPDASDDRPYPLTIALEGNIGCGKSSVLDRLEESGISVLREPLQEWRDVEGTGENLLARLYESPEEFQYPFQTYAMLTMLEDRLRAARDTPVLVTERSLYR